MICKHGVDAHRHHSESEQWLACYRENERRDLRNTVVFIVLLVSAVIALKLLHAILFYGDPSCAFAECRKVTDVAP